MTVFDEKLRQLQAQVEETRRQIDRVLFRLEDLRRSNETERAARKKALDELIVRS